MNVPVPFELLLTLSQHTTKTLAEVGSLFIVIAGVWLFFSELPFPSLKFAKTRRIVASIALAIAGTLLIIAFHWGQFG